MLGTGKTDYAAIQEMVDTGSGSRLSRGARESLQLLISQAESWPNSVNKSNDSLTSSI